MLKMLLALLAIATAAPLSAAPQPAVDRAVYTDPVHDAAHPARMEVVHIPSGGVDINGVIYVAAGAGPHPVVILCHGLPGNEKNLDLAQAIRRAGWTVVTFNYRGSWGSPGNYRFAQNLQDGEAVLAYVENTANAAAFGFDAKHIVMLGHSMGGWVTAMTAAHHPELAGAVLVSASNLHGLGVLPRAAAIKAFADNGVEALAGTSPEIMADEAIANQAAFDWAQTAAGLAKLPMLVASSDDGLAPGIDALAAAIRAQGGRRLTTVHVATDHSWSDARVRLASEVITWLRALPA